MPLTAPSFANRRGIIAMCTAMACFVTNDALVKYTSESMASAQLIFIRGLFATALLLAVATAQGRIDVAGAACPHCATHGVRHLLNRRVLLRAGLDAFATVAYLTALFNMQIGNATAINMAAPLFITLIAVLALGEKVSACALGGRGLWFCRRAADRATRGGCVQLLGLAVPAGHAGPCGARPDHPHH
jgi:drug/metabolite transporter (DMT)-like permease